MSIRPLFLLRHPPCRHFFARPRIVEQIPSPRPGYVAYTVIEFRRVDSPGRVLFAKLKKALFNIPLPRHEDIWQPDPAVLEAISRPQFEQVARSAIEDYFHKGGAPRDELKLHADPALVPSLDQIRSLRLIGIHGQAGEMKVWECLLNTDKEALNNIVAQKSTVIFHPMQNSHFACSVEEVAEDKTEHFTGLGNKTRTLLTFEVTDVNGKTALVKLSSPWIDMLGAKFNVMDPNKEDFCHWIVADVDNIVQKKMNAFVLENMKEDGELENKKWYKSE